MKIIKYIEFVGENNAQPNRTLLFYAFDWDDNILNMPTVIHMEKKEGDFWTPIDVTTSQFAVLRSDTENYRLNGNSFNEFRDFGPRGDNAFIIDTKKAISQNKFGPSWDDFIECLSNGCAFAIISARGHEPNSIRKSVEYIIDEILTPDQQEEMYKHLLKYAYLYKDEEHDRILRTKPTQNKLVQKYLDLCEYIGVASTSRGGSPASPEKAKEDALMEFHDKVNNFAEKLGWSAKIGFSDDDAKNVKHIETLINNLKKERFPNIIEFSVKNTNNPKNVTTKVRSMTETSNQGTGLESSVLTCTQFGNMTGSLYPTDAATRQDDYLNQRKRQTNYLAGVSKEFSKDFIKSKNRKGKINKNPSK